MKFKDLKAMSIDDDAEILVLCRNTNTIKHAYFDYDLVLFDTKTKTYREYVDDRDIKLSDIKEKALIIL